MKTFREYVETVSSFELTRTVDLYKSLGGDGKKSVPYPGMQGWYLHPNGIVSDQPAAAGEHQPVVNPYED